MLRLASSIPALRRAPTSTSTAFPAPPALCGVSLVVPEFRVAGDVLAREPAVLLREGLSPVVGSRLVRAVPVSWGGKPPSGDAAGNCAARRCRAGGS